MIITIITTAKNGNPRDPDDPPVLPRGLYLFQQAKKCTHVNNEEKINGGQQWPANTLIYTNNIYKMLLLLF